MPPVCPQRTPVCEPDGTGRATIDNRNSGCVGWNSGPSFIEERHSGGRHAWRPHDFKCLRARLRDRAHRSDGHKLRVDDVQKVARREAIGRVDDVGLAPADELLPDIEGERTMREGRCQATHRQRRPTGSPISKIKAPRVVDMVVRACSEVYAAGKLDPGSRLEEGFLTHQQVADEPRRIVDRRLRKSEAAPLDNPRCDTVCASAAPAVTSHSSRTTRPTRLTVGESPAT